MSYNRTFTIDLPAIASVSAQLKDFSGVNIGDSVSWSTADAIEDLPIGVVLAASSTNSKSYLLTMAIPDSLTGALVLTNTTTGRVQSVSIAPNMDTALTEPQAAQLAACATAAVRINAVPGTPTQPVEIIASPDNPDFVWVRCTANKEGATFTFTPSDNSEDFVGSVYRAIRNYKGTTDDTLEVLVAMPPSSVLAANGFSPATYVVKSGTDLIGTITVPDEGGNLRDLVDAAG